MNEKSSIEYCRNLVRTRDYNRYLLSFFVPRGGRANLLSILALNVELQSIPSKTTEPMAALVRIQWWRDEITKIYDGVIVETSPILISLTETINRCKIPKDNFETLLLCYDDIIRGTPRDPDDALYDLLSGTLLSLKVRNRFSKKLQLHDSLDGDPRFRALRLWVGF
jgi:phytoene/squalene synthetase